MRNLGIQAIRHRKKYNIPSGIVQGKIASNLINRDFNTKQKNQVWSADITYLPLADGSRSYLFAVKDLYNKEIVCYSVSKIINMPLVIKCLKKALKKINTKKLIIHTDQGTHFTSKIYQKLLDGESVNISHSRRGNCLDNAPIESFFSLYKNESFYINKPYNHIDVCNQIDKYMLYYNQQRIQIGLNGKTPHEFNLSA